MENQNSPLALPAEKLVTILKKMGFRDMTEELLQQDIESGAPQNADGTFNLIHYMAWMVKEVNSNGNESDATQTD